MPPKNPLEKYFEHIHFYQYYFFTVIYLSKVPLFWHVLSIIFLSPPMTYTCKGYDNSTKNPCPCEEPIWDRSVFEETLQTKYKIICEKNWLVSFSQSVLYIGMLLGAFSFGLLSDKFGRLPTFCISCMTVGISGFLVAFVPSVILVMILRCLEGIGSGGAIVTGYVFMVEYCGTSYREMVAALYHIPMNVSHTSLAGISYLFRHCDTFQVVISVPSFLFGSMWCLTQESPKWLLDVGHVEKATKVMEKIERCNGHPTEHIKAELEAFHASQGSSKTLRLSFWQIFGHKKLTINLMCMSMIYFSCGMGYYGVTQYIGKMSGNIHRNVAISGSVLIPGTLTCAFLLKIFGRRVLLMATCFLSGSLMLVVVILPEDAATVRLLTACVCNSFFFMSFIIVFLYGVELFPTSIRNSVLGFLSLLSRVGQICAPPVNALPQMVSGTIFGCMAILGGLLCLPLPETKNIELPSSLEDSKNLSRRLPGIRT